MDLSCGRILAVLGVLFLISLSLTYFGIALASRLQTMESFQAVMNFLVMPLFFLSGAMFPMANLPAWLSFLMKLDPLTYGVDALRHQILPESIKNLGFLVHYPLGWDLALLSGLTLMMGFLGTCFFSQQE